MRYIFTYLLHPNIPITEAIIVTNPVIAKDLNMSLELLFQVIIAKIAKIKFKLLIEVK